MLEKYDREGDDQARIATLEAVIQVAYHNNYKGGFTKFVDDYEAAFAELNILDKDNWQTDNAKKRRLYENGLPPAMYWIQKDMADKSFTQTCAFLRVMAAKQNRWAK